MEKMKKQPAKFVVALNILDSKTEYSVNLRNTRIAAGSSLLFIVVLGILTSYSAPALADMAKPGSRFRFITADQLTWIGSLPNLGCLFGNVLGGYITQKFGRKASLMFLSIFYLISWLMVAYAPSVTWIYVGRLIGGICGGATNVAVPAYIVEIAPTEIRGQLASGHQIACSIGVLLVMGLGIILRWSWLALVGAAVVALASCVMLFMPESPPWLVRASRSAEAQKGLEFLKGKHLDSQKELKDILDNIALHKTENIKLEEFYRREVYKPVIIALGLMFFQQACGVSPILAYTVEIFDAAGSTINPTTAATVVALAQVVGTVLSGSLIERSGRRQLFIGSGSFMTLALTALGAFFYLIQQNTDIQNSYGFVPIICIVLFVFSYSVGNGPIPFVMIPELTPLKFRSIVMAFGGVVCSLLAFIMNKLFEIMRTELGNYGLIWTHSFFSLFSAIFGYFILPETKGLTISQISTSFSS